MARSELRPLVEFIDSVRAYFRGRCCDGSRRRDTVALRPRAGAPLNEGSVGVYAVRPAVTRVRPFHPPTRPTLAAREGSDDVGGRLGDGEGESALGASEADGCAEGFREGGGVQGG